MCRLCIDFPRIFLAGLCGGAGKTTLSVGIIAALKKYGKSPAPFKKGPDYIDAGWLALAAGRPCINLDTFLLNQKQIVHSFLFRSRQSDLSLIEGSRGLYDGIDISGSTSSAEVAKLLRTPVILCADATKTTRTLAAVIFGCMQFDPALPLGGVILNRVAGSRHEKKLRENIEHYCGIPVVGAVPRLEEENFPERHMGLIPTPEHALARKAVEYAAQLAENHMDIPAILRIAASASACIPSFPDETVSGLSAGESLWEEKKSLKRTAFSRKTETADAELKIGIIRDSAFQFYYPENIEAIAAAGGRPVYIRATEDKNLPSLDALYIGGGFPETHGEILSKNESLRNEIRHLAEKGFPIYAECGGLMYLGESLRTDGQTWPMCGVLPIVFGLSEKPQGLGYTIVRVDGENPYYPAGTEIRGHEFRYSRVLEWRGNEKDLVFFMKRGKGFLNGRDGISYKNVFATYTHIHALGVPEWAPSLIANAKIWRASGQNISGG